MRFSDFAEEPWRSRALDLLRHLDAPGGRSHAELDAWRRERKISPVAFLQLLAHLDCEGWARSTGHEAPKGADGRACDNLSRAHLVRWYAVRQEGDRRISRSDDLQFGLY